MADDSPLVAEKSLSAEDHAFVDRIESWGSGDQMLDVVTLDNGEILLITDQSILLFASRDAFEAGTGARTISRHGLWQLAAAPLRSV